MTNARRPLALLLAVCALALLAPEPAAAYGGPGSVISGIGALLAAGAAVLAAIFGFFWFPVKRLIQKLRGTEDEGEPAEASS